MKSMNRICTRASLSRRRQECLAISSRVAWWKTQAREQVRKFILRIPPGNPRSHAHGQVPKNLSTHDKLGWRERLVGLTLNECLVRREPYFLFINLRESIPVPADVTWPGDSLLSRWVNGSGDAVSCRPVGEESKLKGGLN